jgi:hypothetical protein
MNKKSTAVLSILMVAVFMLSCAGFAATTTKTVTKTTKTTKRTVKVAPKAAPRAKYVYNGKMTQEQYITVASSMRYQFIKNRDKKMEPKERIEANKKIFSENNVTMEDFRDYNMYLRDNPETFKDVMAKINAKTTEMQKGSK